MASFDTFLNSFDPDKKGIQFEHFVKWFLKNDPKWKTQVEEVWLWDEYPERWGPDCGIDLVFRCKDGDICAVQAKCYDEKYSITKKDVDTFLSESSRQGIDRRLLIASTDHLGRNARQVCDAQEKPVDFHLLSDFNKAAIDYPRNLSGLNNAKPKKLPKPRRHQKTAIKDVLKGFESASRGQMIMACGTGKTFTTLWIKEELEAKTTLVLLPSLSLLSQTLWEWTFASNTPFEALCVCSDETVGKSQGVDSIVSTIQDVSFPTTSNPDDIKKFLKRDVNKVVFSTYHSSPLIAQAYANSNIPIFDLAVADEAHRCTGEIGKAFTTILDNSLIKAHKRLFTTATSRVYSANMKKKHSEMGVDIADMSNELFFGKEFHNLTFPQAIDKDLLTDYRVVIVGVDKPMIADWIDRRQLVRTDKNEATDAKTLASQIGLIKAIKDYDLKRMISFHSRVKKAELFASELHDAIDVVSEEHRPEGKLYSDYVSGEMVSSKRKLKLSKLKALHDADRGILTNARCLSEGIDVPSLDGIAFIDPRSSQVDIIQAVGRAIRKSDEKSFGTIVLPVFIEENDNAEIAIQSSNFKPIWSILNALKSHDETLSLELGQIRTNLGRQIYSGSKSLSIPQKIIFDLPTSIDSSFADSLKTILIENTTDSWDFWFGLLQNFVEQEGHARPEDLYKSPKGYKLGSWVSNQRRRKDILDAKRRIKLESLPGWVWDAIEFRWKEGFDYLQEFLRENGHARPPVRYKAEDGYKLGKWADTQRYRKDGLLQERISMLESLSGWAWNVIEYQWDEGFEHLQAFFKENGHAVPEYKYKSPDGFALGGWIGNQRRNIDILDAEKRIRLESVPGWIWDVQQQRWDKALSHLELFVKENGHSMVKHSYRTADGFQLGHWVVRQRKQEGAFTQERKSKLESLSSWTWDMFESQWEKGFAELEAFVKESGHSRPENRYITPEGYALGDWVSRQRKHEGAFTQEKKSRLESLPGWVWKVLEDTWEKGFESLKAFIKETGNARPTYNYVNPDDFKLGRWVSNQRKEKDNLIKNRLILLESLPGWAWNANNFLWEEGFEHLQAFFNEFGHARPVDTYKSHNGYHLGQWVASQRFKKKSLIPERIIKLESLSGWAWNVPEFLWEEGYTHLETFVKENGHSRPENRYITPEGYALGDWVSIQRHAKKYKLTQERIGRLESLPGWVWDVIEYQWEESWLYLQEFIKNNGHSYPAARYKTSDGFGLGSWVRNQRLNKNSLTNEKLAKLESLTGWTWNIKKTS